MFELFYNFHGLNQEIFLFFNKITNLGMLPQILYGISFCFNIVNFAIIYTLYCIYYYIQLKKSGNAGKENFWTVYDKVVEIGIIYALFGMVFTILKFSVRLPRPFCSIQAGNFTTIMHTSTEQCFTSFPSSHTGLVFLTGYLIWPYINVPSKIAMTCLVTLAAISRMTLAMHYPADLVYGIIITVLVIIVGKTLYNICYDKIIKSIGEAIFAGIFR